MTQLVSSLSQHLSIWTSWKGFAENWCHITFSILGTFLEFSTRKWSSLGQLAKAVLSAFVTIPLQHIEKEWNSFTTGKKVRHVSTIPFGEPWKRRPVLTLKIVWTRWRLHWWMHGTKSTTTTCGTQLTPYLAVFASLSEREKRELHRYSLVWLIVFFYLRIINIEAISSQTPCYQTVSSGSYFSVPCIFVKTSMGSKEYNIS